MTERLHLPPFPLAFDPILFHYVQVLMAASFQFSCVGKSWSVPMTRGGRWWHSLSRVIRSSIPMVSRWSFSYHRWQSFAFKGLMFISLWIPFGLALSSALPGGADSIMCNITSEREDLLLIQAWILLLCFSVLPTVASDKDQHSHHEFNNQESSNDIEDSEISFRRDAMRNHKYNNERDGSTFREILVVHNVKMVTSPVTGSPCLCTTAWEVRATIIGSLTYT